MNNWPKANSSWNDERVELLTKLWQDGLSPTQIATQLGGVTRNAVIGKAHRLGLSGRDAPSKPQRIVPKAAPAQPAGDHPWRAAGGPERQILHPAGNRVYKVAPDKPLPKSKAASIALAPRPWETRKFGECAYPIEGPDGGWLSCCNPGPQRVDWCYCADHKEVMRGQSNPMSAEAREMQAQRARLRNRERAALKAAEREAA